MSHQNGKGFSEQVKPIRVSQIDGQPLIQRALRPPEYPPPAIFQPATPPPRAAAPPDDYAYPLPPDIVQAVQRAESAVRGNPRLYEVGLYRIYSARNLSERHQLDVTMYFLQNNFRNVFDMLAGSTWYEVHRDFPRDPARGDEEFMHVVCDQVYQRHLLPLAEDYFADNPGRLQQLQQRRPVHVGPGEALV